MQQYFHIYISIAALVIALKYKAQYKGERLNKLWFFYVMENDVIVKSNEIDGESWWRDRWNYNNNKAKDSMNIMCLLMLNAYANVHKITGRVSINVANI